jgi:ATP synthase F1 gamma subunit
MDLNKLRKELQFNTELLQLVETLKNVAGSQYHLLEKEKERFDRFMDAFSGFFRVVDLVDVENPLVRVLSDVLGILIVTSDSGFMGGLNQGVIRAAMAAQGDLPREKVSLMLIGEKGIGPLADQGWEFKAFPGIAVDGIYEEAVDVRDYIVREVVEGRMGKVVVAYPRPISFTAQTVEVVDLLPCGELFDKDAESDVASRVRGMGILSESRRVIVESSFPDMVEYLSSVWVTSKLYEIFEDSKLAEFSARVMHLEGSLQRVEKDQKKLKQQCFKASHEKIDKGMRESYAAKSGREKTKKKREDAA